MKGGRCNAFNQQYKSDFSDEVLKIISIELNFSGSKCDRLEKYFNFSNKYEKQYAKKFVSQSDDYRDMDEKKTDFINKIFSMLPIHKELSKSDSNKTQMEYDAIILYHSTMWDENLFILK